MADDPNIATPYKLAINKVVKDQGSMAYAGIIEALQARKLELDELWITERDREGFDADRIRVLKRAGVEIIKLLNDIKMATAVFAEPAQPAAPTAPESKEVPSGPAY